MEDEPHRGGLPDRRGAPVFPHRRRAFDFRRRARFIPRNPWMLPVATGRLGKAGGGPFSQLLWGLAPEELTPLLDRVLDDENRPIAVSVMRSDIAADAELRNRLASSLAHLARRADIASHPVMAPSEALRVIRKHR